MSNEERARIVIVGGGVIGLSIAYHLAKLGLDGGIYLKADAGKLVLGGFEPKAKLWDPQGPDGDRAFLELPEDWEQFEPFMHAGLERVPALERAGIRRFMNGPESFTPDTRPLLGESPFLDGFYVAAGFNSTGMMSSAGAGRVMAQWIAGGEAPMDLWDMDIARFDRASSTDAYLAARVTEAAGEVFRMHWPYRQPSAGRCVRRSALHDAFAAAGAVFGAPAGWERPLWFARDESESRIRYSYGAQHWWPAAAHEAEAIRDGVGLLELTPFTKIDVRGADALALFQRLCTAAIDIEPDRAVYTLMLNPRGGIEADVTVTRLDECAFRIVSGAATRAKDLAWIERHRRRPGLAAEVFDATSSEAVWGSSARARARSCSGSLRRTSRTGHGRSPHLESVLIGGLEKHEVVVVPYRPEWPDTFRVHADRISMALGDAALRIEHIGSTAVPGLAAKPVVDMLVVVENSADERTYLQPMLDRGYHLRVREPDFEQHRMFRTPERDIHVHFLSAGSAEIERYLVFREALRGNAVWRERYQAFKRSLADRDWHDVNAYAAAKTNLIEEIIRRSRPSESLEA